MTLTDNQKKVYDAVLAGSSTVDYIVTNTGLTKQTVNPVINSLIKKEVLTKSEDGTITPIVIPATSPVIPTVVEESNDIQKRNLENSNVTDPESKVEETTLLIPYISTPTQGAELKAALRTWAKHYDGKLRVVIVGDREDWFTDQIIHIAHEPHMIAKECGGCIAPVLEVNPQADVAHKILTAIATNEVQGDFILSNDDIFLLGRTTFEDLAALKFRGKLTDDLGKIDGPYRINAGRTAESLKKAGLPVINYGTHTPMVLNADKMLDVITQYNAFDKGYLLTSLYYNTVYPDARPIHTPGNQQCRINASVYRPLNGAEDAALVDDIFSNRKFINTNDTGWKYLEPIFNKLNPSPSQFEK